MEEHKKRLGALMRLSWEVQRRKGTTRARSLTAAWAIMVNEDITIGHLVRKHSRSYYANKVQPSELALFNL